LAIATTGSSFGTPGSTQVTDANGAGVSGSFATGQAFPSGNGLAGSTFSFFFNVLPGDGTRGATVNSADVASAKVRTNLHETNGPYSPYFDYLGAGVINSVDSIIPSIYMNTGQSSIIAPVVPGGLQSR
ncbi:MAG TPA: hypothetical protein VHY91_02650, partial [Pirellulales bacterium]|nr:hypothetical protein [Pirellulales bacterium]